jgi:hypothetical protein
MTHQVVFPGALFPLGRLAATPGAIDALQRANQHAFEFVARHARGDWSELDEHDTRENQFSLEHGFRVVSNYKTRAGEVLWIITEADRSVTTLLLPDEY